MQKIRKSLSHTFFEFKMLKEGTHAMTQAIIRCYQKMGDKKVSPDVKPGFLRNQFHVNPPEKGKKIQKIIEEVEEKIYPGIMQWQSPKFFGYFAASTSATNVIAEMFANTFFSPAFNYSVSPSHTQLQNIVMDWTSIALKLPECFLLKNSGGGTITNSTSQSTFITIHAAKKRKIEQLQIKPNSPQVLKFIGYFSQMSHNSGQKGLMMKDIHQRRAIKVKYSEQLQNYQLDTQDFQQQIKTDIQNGLVPFWFTSTYGTTLCGSIQLSEKIVQICKKYKIWLNVDAAYLGSTWICEEYRPESKNILENADSICINMSKILLLGNGGSVMFIKDKNQLTRAFGGTSEFSFYSNTFTGNNDVVDYKDWTVSLGRRALSFRFLFLYEHYGLQNLRQLIYQLDEKSKLFQRLIIKQDKIFEMYVKAFGLVGFRVKDNKGKVSNEITKLVSEQVRNIDEGYLTPGSFEQVNFIRVVVGNNSTSEEDIRVYFDKIKNTAQKFIQNAKIINELPEENAKHEASVTPTNQIQRQSKQNQNCNQLNP